MLIGLGDLQILGLVDDDVGEIKLGVPKLRNINPDKCPYEIR